ncbi:hypothetical protein GUITHDRAFT_107294 [Guillardia theta CCMP2712]|uniref:AAA+ ATPase domain-containing protein n=1 Tax=Guillardia theta (strain CCMP2712) TaxID=905079 RepID=L1JF60_GUITC|nr:hypothetical protein GUITHDRAFT_107294 [Guillardia theta CCMP2712]EKX46942.1 hypothetical protein GUITHDRAFT_107294 [Guillardia theta CCMP2712]|eukprot:XP_005833922.1 hypothetical protein GUITHDRAFT_107294 [Guillardia theta CCMP2712]
MIVGMLVPALSWSCSSVSCNSKWVSSWPGIARDPSCWSDGLVKHTRGGGGSEDQVKLQIEEVQREIKEVKQEIKEVKQEIKEVQQEIKEVLKRIEHEQDSTMKAVLVERVTQLGERLKQLGERERQLRERVKQLDKERNDLQRQSRKSDGLRIDWVESEAGLDRTGFCHGNKYFRFDASYLQGDGEILLYCRKAFHEQQRFLREQVLESRALGWIQGPPGTGKTTTTLAFCLSLGMKEWSVTFFQLDATKWTECIQIVRSKRRSCTIPAECSLKWTRKILEDWPDSEKRLVVIDGYLRHESHHARCYRACTRWLLGDRQNRRVIVVTSMSGGKVRDRFEDDVNLMPHTVVSWTTGEYLNAVKCDAFYKRVKAMLALHDTAVHIGMRIRKRNGTKEEQIMSKHYLAGGSCRYMFEKTAAVVKQRLDRALASCRNLEHLFQGIVGDSSLDAVNHLTARYMHGEEASWMPVSKYVAMKLAEVAEVGVLKRLLDGTGIPSIRGYVFELLFFKKVKQGLTLTYRQGVSRVNQVWMGCPVFLFDANEVMESLPQERACLRPINVFQPGYDAIIVNVRAKLVELVQVTVSSSHSFKLSPFAKALKKLNIPTKGWKVKVVFIVPPERLEDFQIDTIKNCGAMEEYGWKKGSEGKQADVASIEML